VISREPLLAPAIAHNAVSPRPETPQFPFRSLEMRFRTLLNDIFLFVGQVCWWLRYGKRPNGSGIHNGGEASRHWLPQHPVTKQTGNRHPRCSSTDSRAAAAYVSALFELGERTSTVPKRRANAHPTRFTRLASSFTPATGSQLLCLWY
jgi:hypothetical protein